MTKGSAAYVRRYYGVPAKRGARIKFEGQDGTIVGFHDASLRVRLDDDPKRVIPCHPLEELDDTRSWPSWERLARVGLEAAQPVLAAHVRRQDEEERERRLALDQDHAEEAEGNHGAPDLVERMAYAIPVRLVKSEAVGIGAARREYIARAVLPVVENEIERARGDERRKVAAEYEDLLGCIWLYIGWRYVTKQLTTPQKEMFADAVEAWSRRLNDDNPDEPSGVDRWWRPDAPARQIGEARAEDQPE